MRRLRSGLDCHRFVTAWVMGGVEKGGGVPTHLGGGWIQFTEDQKLREKEESAAASTSNAPSSSKSAQKIRISIRNGPLNLLSKGEETEEEEVVDMGGGGSEIEGSKRSSVDRQYLKSR